ncbi:MAG: hypothetical protein LBC44_00455 [Mycoplasmataceae bacterium]|jgi:hypothetical protein|nr:hypothetical protein [Mycoplasmataceae bacterium]
MSNITALFNKDNRENISEREITGNDVFKYFYFDNTTYFKFVIATNLIEVGCFNADLGYNLAKITKKATTEVFTSYKDAEAKFEMFLEKTKK